MNSTLPWIDLKKLQKRFDWKLLLFLVLFLDVKLWMKILAIAMMYILRPDLRFGFKFRNSRLPLFYLLVIVAAFVPLIVNADHARHNYLPAFLTGLGTWLLCLLAAHQVKLSVERNDTDVIHNTLSAFFVLNAVFSLLNIVAIIYKTHAIDPYTYQGEYQKYFISTGDQIKGITLDTSTTNAVISAFGAIYFLMRKNAFLLITCMATLLLTTSNTLNIILLVLLALIFIFNSARVQKSMIAICVFMLVVFMAKISPQNNAYVMETVNNMLHRPNPPLIPLMAPVPITLRPDNTLTPEEKRLKKAALYIDSLNSLQHPAAQAKAASQTTKQLQVTEQGRIFIPKGNIYTAPYQNLVTTPAEQLPLAIFIQQHKNELPISGKPFRWSGTPGKLIGIRQSIGFLKAHPSKIFTGDGMGNFSSKLAFKTTCLNISGGYPEKYRYIDADFMKYHLDLYLNYFSKRAGYHSLTNSPFSVYDQLLTEYGIIGLFIFFVYYLGYFAKNIKLLTYGLPILLITLAVFFIDYWFEQLSVLVVFELMLFLDIKEHLAKALPRQIPINHLNLPDAKEQPASLQLQYELE